MYEQGWESTALWWRIRSETCTEDCSPRTIYVAVQVNIKVFHRHNQPLLHSRVVNNNVSVADPPVFHLIFHLNNGQCQQTPKASSSLISFGKSSFSSNKIKARYLERHFVAAQAKFVNKYVYLSREFISRSQIYLYDTRSCAYRRKQIKLTITKTINMGTWGESMELLKRGSSEDLWRDAKETSGRSSCADEALAASDSLLWTPSKTRKEPLSRIWTTSFIQGWAISGRQVVARCWKFRASQAATTSLQDGWPHQSNLHCWGDRVECYGGDERVLPLHSMQRTHMRGTLSWNTRQLLELSSVRVKSKRVSELSRVESAGTIRGPMRSDAIGLSAFRLEYFGENV